MTFLEALDILEAATLECNARHIDIPEVTAALDLLEPYVRPDWVVPQFRYHLQRESDNEDDLRCQQPVLSATFPVIRDSIMRLMQ
jgi:hypothetical protein